MRLMFLTGLTKRAAEAALVTLNGFEPCDHLLNKPFGRRGTGCNSNRFNTFEIIWVDLFVGFDQETLVTIFLADTYKFDAV